MISRRSIFKWLGIGAATAIVPGCQNSERMEGSTTFEPAKRLITFYTANGKTYWTDSEGYIYKCTNDDEIFHQRINASRVHQDGYFRVDSWADNGIDYEIRQHKSV